MKKNLPLQNDEKWTHKPPCVAQKELVKLFDNGTINENTSARTAYALHYEFSKFNMPVFSNNFRQQRLLRGFECAYLSYSYFFLSIVFIAVF
jgi:hypothetical protein